MESKTKSNVTQEMIKKIAGKHFPGENISSIEELTEGMFNSAYVIRGTGAMEKGIVLKIGPVPGTEILIYEKDILRTEVEVYGLLEGRGIKIPKILTWDYSHEELPCDYFFMEYVDGVMWKDCIGKISRENRRQLMYELGKSNAIIHGVKGSRFGYLKEDERFHFDTWGGAFSSMMSDILEDGRMRNCRLPYGEIEEAVKIHLGCLNEITVPRLVDFDMWAGNVFIDEADCSHITGIIDFERSFYGDPAADFTSAGMLINDVEEEKDFQRGYSEISGIPFTITKGDRIRMNLYRLYMAVILYVESYRYDEEYEAKVKGFFEGYIRKLLDALRAGA